MSLPSVKSLLDQANKLARYMGDKHRFRLKSGSALEAMAAMYDQHDWNTLHGLAQRNAGAVPATPPSHAEGFPLIWSAVGHPQMVVGRNDWYRHTLASGGALADRQGWLRRHFDAHVERGGAGVFINAFGELPLAAREALHAKQLLVDLERGDCTFPVNLMADMTPEDIGAMTTELIFARDRGMTDSYWKNSAARVVTIVARALREIGEQISFSRLTELFPPMAQPTKLHELMQSLAAGSDTRVHLRAILAPHGTDGGIYSENTWALNYGVLSRALGQLAASPWTYGLFSTARDAQGLFSLLYQRKCLVIECPERAAGLPERALQYAMSSALTLRRALDGDNPMPPWVFAVSEADGYLSSILADMAARGRGAQVALLLTTRVPNALSAHPAGRELLANVWNTLHLRGCSPENLAELLAKMGDNPVLVQPGQVMATI